MSKEIKQIELHSEALRTAIQKRNEYFQSLPDDQKEEALKFQEFIDLELKKAGNQQNRLSVIQSLIQEKVSELHKCSTLLSKNLHNLSKSLKEFSEEKPNKS